MSFLTESGWSFAAALICLITFAPGDGNATKILVAFSRNHDLSLQCAQFCRQMKRPNRSGDDRGDDVCDCTAHKNLNFFPAVPATAAPLFMGYGVRLEQDVVKHRGSCSQIFETRNREEICNAHFLSGRFGHMCCALLWRQVIGHALTIDKLF